MKSLSILGLFISLINLAVSMLIFNESVNLNYINSYKYNSEDIEHVTELIKGNRNYSFISGSGHIQYGEIENTKFVYEMHDELKRSWETFSVINDAAITLIAASVLILLISSFNLFSAFKSKKIN
jgi:hypothetical protein